MKFKSRKQGIVLITTMLSVVLVVMLLSAVVYSNMGSLRLTSNFYDREAALMAADSGVQYAVTRLQNDITWRGVDKYSLSFSKTKGLLQVEEENGNVIGIINLSNGRRAAFRIKFNCEDGAGGLDDMADSQHPLDLVNVSSNNLYSTASSYAYIADKNGKVAVKDGKAETVKFGGGPNDIYPFIIPKQTCRLVVQGLSGTAVRDASPSDLYRLDGLKGNITPVCAECYASVNNDTVSDSSLVSAAADIKITGSDELLIDKVDSADSTRLSSLGNIGITHGGKFNFNGETYTGAGKDYTVNGEKKKSNTYDKNDFTALAWEDIPKASSTGNTLESGTYVWSKDENNNNVLKYYASSFTDASKASGQPTAVYNYNKAGSSLGSKNGVKIDFDNMSMIFEQNSYVKGDFNVLTEDSGGRPIVGFSYQQDNRQNILTTASNGADNPGSVYIQGTTLGQGAITSEGDITIQGTSVMESTPEMGVSVYSHGDVTINEIEGTTQAAEDAKEDLSSVNIDSEHKIAALDLIQANKVDPDKLQKRYVEMTSAFREQLKIYMTQQGIASDIKFNVSRYGENLQFDLSESLVGVFALYIQEKHLYDADPRTYTEYYCGYTPEDFLRDNIALLKQYDSSLNNFLTNIETITKDSYSCLGNNKPLNYFNLDLGKKKINTEKLMANPTFKKMFGDAKGAEKVQQYTNLVLKYGDLTYNDLDISGVIYACGNISINTGDHVLNLTGNMVAYGGDPATDDPGANSKVNINLNASKIGLTYDPTYLNNLLALSKRRQLKKGMYCTY